MRVFRICNKIYIVPLKKNMFDMPLKNGTPLMAKNVLERW